MRKCVEDLLSSNISTYKLSKKSNIPYMTIHDLRSGKSTIDNAKFETIEKLYYYALSLKNDHSTE